jgi:hypothetical protein
MEHAEADLHFEMTTDAPNVRVALEHLQERLNVLTADLPDGVTARAAYVVGSVKAAEFKPSEFTFEMSARIELAGKVAA